MISCSGWLKRTQIFPTTKVERCLSDCLVSLPKDITNFWVDKALLYSNSSKLNGRTFE